VIVALTGGIASGKTLVADHFRDLGVPIIDTDVIARQLVRPDEPVWHLIKESFGSEYICANGELDRSKLADLVFANANERLRLEAIMHPAIFAEVERQLQEIGEKPLIIVVVPLLYEVAAEERFAAVISVTASSGQQISRLVATRGYSRAEAEARLAAQLPAVEKAGRADYVIDNSGDIAATSKQINALYQHLTGKDA